MGRVFDIFSREEIADDFRDESNPYDGQFIEYDPQMPLALEIFTELDKAILLDGCWVPLSWDESGIVVLVDDPPDLEKQASIHTALKTPKLIFVIGTKEDIEIFINRSFSELGMHDFLSKAMSGEGPIDVTKLVRWSKLKGSVRVFILYLQELDESPASPPLALLKEPEVREVIQAEARKKLQILNG